jgi:hypothetical protein
MINCTKYVALMISWAVARCRLLTSVEGLPIAYYHTKALHDAVTQNITAVKTSYLTGYLNWLFTKLREFTTLTFEKTEEKNTLSIYSSPRIIDSIQFV